MISFGVGINASSFKVQENKISSKLSVAKILKVELFNTTLAAVLGEILNPFKSSLTNSRSPSLIMHGSSL